MIITHLFWICNPCAKKTRPKRARSYFHRDEGGLPFPLRGASAKKMQAFSEPNGFFVLPFIRATQKRTHKGCVRMSVTNDSAVNQVLVLI